MKSRIPVRKKLTALFLVILFTGYYGGSTMCYHTHQDEEGVLVHSHLFGESAHSHSQHGLEALAWAWAGLLMLVAGFFVVSALLLPGIFSFFTHTIVPEPVSIGFRNLRGPPYYNLS